ncbi:MAG: dTMP kinase [Candidatus Woesearchaeota archaeon]
MQGFACSFEGLDRCGKGSQLRFLLEHAKQKGLNICADREPGGTSHGEVERRSLQDPLWLSRVNQGYEGIAPPLNPDEPLTPEAEIFGYLKARAQFMQTKVLPFILNKGIFLLDRAGDSTTAYQGFGLYKGDLDMLKLIIQCNHLAMRCVPLKRTYLLDIPVEEMRKRTDGNEFQTGKDRIEQRDDDYFERVRKGYLWLAKQNSERFMIIDGTLPKEKISEIILTDFDFLMRENGFNV